MKVISDIVGKLGKTGLKLKAQSPVIFFVAGTICVGGAVITAHRAGRHIDETLDIAKERIDNIKSLKDATEIEDENGKTVPYSEKQWKKDMAKAYGGAAWDIGKLYLPVAGFTAAAVGCYFGEYKTMAEWLGGAIAAAELAQKNYNNLTNNIVEQDGIEKLQQYLYSEGNKEHADVAIEQRVDEETGEVKDIKVKNIDLVKDISLAASPYAVEMKYCKGFTKDPNYNVRWLECVQRVANTKLEQYGYLFLYDVYEALGCLDWISPEAVKASHCVGWLVGVGDGEVKFNMVPVPTRCMHEGEDLLYLQTSCLVDFNVVGTILDKI
jgi:hypothetical protein